MSAPSHPQPGLSGNRPQNAPDSDAVAQQLAADINACQSLLTLMQAEREALQARDMDALGSVIEQKAAHLVQLEQSAATRTHWAQQAQAADPESAWHQLLEDLREPELNEQWQELKTLTASCREQNEVNGKLLARSQQTFGRLLNIMRGQSETPSLYNQKGSKAGGPSSHTFGEA